MFSKEYWKGFRKFLLYFGMPGFLFIGLCTLLRDMHMLDFEDWTSILLFAIRGVPLLLFIGLTIFLWCDTRKSEPKKPVSRARFFRVNHRPQATWAEEWAMRRICIHLAFLAVFAVLIFAIFPIPNLIRLLEVSLLSYLIALCYLVSFSLFIVSMFEFMLVAGKALESDEQNLWKHVILMMIGFGLSVALFFGGKGLGRLE